MLQVQVTVNIAQEWKEVAGLSSCKAFEFGIIHEGRSALLFRGSTERFLALVVKSILFQALRSYFPG